MAIAAAEAVDYVNAGTIECLVDKDKTSISGDEHPPSGRTSRHRTHHRVDLVKEQIRIARGGAWDHENVLHPTAGRWNAASTPKTL